MQNINQEFQNAVTLYKENEQSFLPLIEKFNEIKDVIRNNFSIETKERNWYGKATFVARPALMVDIKDKFIYDTGRFLVIEIHGMSYVMGIGEYGELKDKLYFCESSLATKKKTVIYARSHMFGTDYYCLENKITLVQLFSQLIKKYKHLLIKNG